MKRALASILTGVFTLLIVAAITDLTKTDKQIAARYFRTRNVFQYNENNIAFDPVLGYRLAPFLNVRFNNEEFSTTVRTNALGFRDDATSISNPDVLFLGDSYAFGWGVNETNSVEKEYERITGKKVLNMAAPGYGTIQELLTLYKWEKIAPPFNKQIFLFFCANDLADNQNSSFNLFPCFEENNEKMTFSKPSLQGYDQWLHTTNKWMIHSDIARKSMLAFYFLNAIKNFQVKDIYSDYKPLGANIVDGAKAFILAAESFAHFQQEYHSPVTIIYIPPAQYYKTGQPDRSFILARDVTSKLGLHFIDLGNALTKADYYKLDMHWKASGHRKVALYLAKQGSALNKITSNLKPH